MLSAEDNEILTRVGPKTPMGELMRRFWVPALMSEEIAENDGTPVRVLLLGERLVAFRDTQGRVGLLEESCPHRRTSLALGANEQCGLRCLYHGWKFDVEGRCVDTPAEPVGSTLKDRVRAKAYPTVEKGGVVWTYMGPPDQRPPFPDYEWLNMPAGHSMVFKVQEDCNYAQAVEGTIDTAHAGCLHRSVRWHDPGVLPHEKVLQAGLEVEYTKYGLRYAGLRGLPGGGTYARITIAPLPFYTIIPPDTKDPVRSTRRMANAFVPRDDTSTWHMQWFFDQTRPVDRAFRIREAGLEIVEDYRKKASVDNWYFQDRQMMKNETFSGLRGVLVQDHAVVETQGRITDRTTEHLGTTDVAVVAWRRLMIRAAKELASSGGAPAAVTDQFIPWRQLQAAEVILPPGQSWQQAVPLQKEFAT
ncbi:MAG TPA: Rieske 2Fe-2S domain-containing protein [Steroidobacteraceae bacterium]|nr:Rieske 2Fe-2S domain-containing protein [Steroidobacteraceae bacterium]